MYNLVEFSLRGILSHSLSVACICMMRLCLLQARFHRGGGVGAAGEWGGEREVSKRQPSSSSAASDDAMPFLLRTWPKDLTFSVIAH
jgi:hypothetical protein